MAELSQESITFGKHKGSTISEVLKDRSYCRWLLQQEWFQTNYEYLYNRVKEYDPHEYFFFPREETEEESSFLESYPYFNMIPLHEVTFPLTETEKACYAYYLSLIDDLRARTETTLITDSPYDIKAPSGWLQRFEKRTELPRTAFKTFYESYDLKNIPAIVADIKKEGGHVYKGGDAFKIAKARSLEQEAWWEKILKEKYGEDLGTQYKYEKCIFDFINISTNTVFECKLGVKDFNAKQYRKYIKALEKYRIVYLIARDCVIWIEAGKIFTTDPERYTSYLLSVPLMASPSKFDEVIQDFSVVPVEDISSVFGVH